MAARATTATAATATAATAQASNMIRIHSLDPSKPPALVPRSYSGASPSVDSFEKLGRLGEGTYGVVYKARIRSTGLVVALKRVRMDQENEGMPLSSLREISLLRSLDHENVMQVLDVAVGAAPEDIFLVMEYCEQDMANLMDTVVARGKTTVFQPAEVKCLIQQLLKGVAYLHDHHVIHRDLKLSNLLLTSEGILKIADFGLARLYSDPPEPLTPRVVTLWYRSPELLLGVKIYTTAIDMWSVGCIFGELLRSEPLLAGKIERHQLELICGLLGSPTPSIWPELPSLPFYSSFKFPRIEYDNIRSVFARFTDKTQRFLKAMLVYRPESRMTARDALRHSYFDESPRACAPIFLPTYPELRGNMQATRQQAQLQYESELQQSRAHRRPVSSQQRPSNTQGMSAASSSAMATRGSNSHAGSSAHSSSSLHSSRDVPGAPPPSSQGPQQQEMLSDHRHKRRRVFESADGQDSLMEVGVPVFQAFADY
ncbi:kinase-like domain-containing protein [Entophlyctis helioformis]|nr:kinase-like domain-containing protein [Entophlyctis helioformis]